VSNRLTWTCPELGEFLQNAYHNQDKHVDTSDDVLCKLNTFDLATIRGIYHHFKQKTKKSYQLKCQKVERCVDAFVKLMELEFARIGMMHGNCSSIRSQQISNNVVITRASGCTRRALTRPRRPVFFETAVTISYRVVSPRTRSGEPSSKRSSSPDAKAAIFLCWMRQYRKIAWLLHSDAIQGNAISSHTWPYCISSFSSSNNCSNLKSGAVHWRSPLAQSTCDDEHSPTIQTKQ